MKIISIKRWMKTPTMPDCIYNPSVFCNNTDTKKTNERELGMNKKDLAKQILVLVGGSANIKSVVHCATRLRFKLADSQKADKAAIEKLEGVISVIESSGQFQIVIGNAVAYVYKEFMEVAGIQEESKAAKTDEKQEKIFARIIDTISAIFTPILGAMIGSGIIKGLLMIGTMYGGMDTASGTYRILTAASNAVFYFLPIILAYTSAKKFKANIVIAMVIAGALVYPDMVAAYSNKEVLTFLGLPVITINYTSSVIPIILGTWFLSQTERFLERWIPDVIKSFVIPLISLIVVVPVVYLVVGPLGNYLGLGVAAVYTGLYSLNPIIAGVVLGGFYQSLVVFGIHWALGPIQINNVAVYGFDTITAMYLPAKYAQAGATFAIGLKTKNKELKSSAFTTAATTAMFGITEPAVYGFNLKFKKPFYMASVAGAVGGGLAGVFRCAAGAYGVSNTLTLPVFIGHGLSGMIIAILTAFLLAAVLTFLFGYKDAVEEQSLITESREQVLLAPVSGTLVDLNKIADPMFAAETLGKTLAIEPEEGMVYAPVSGTVTALYPSQHAIGITADSGIEILIHIGIDTAELNGKYFNAVIKQNDVIKKGDLLVEFDLPALRDEGYVTTTMLIVTNSGKYDKIAVLADQQVNCKNELLLAAWN